MAKKGYVTSMVLKFGPPPPYRRQIDDIKVTKKGEVFVCRQQRTCDGAYLVSGSRPCLEWVRLSDEDLEKLRAKQARGISSFWAPRYAASGKKLNGKRVDFNDLQTP